MQVIFEFTAESDLHSVPNPRLLLISLGKDSSLFILDPSKTLKDGRNFFNLIGFSVQQLAKVEF
jgi:hypothetical protein